MVINFKTRRINRGARKLTRTSIIIITIIIIIIIKRMKRQLQPKKYLGKLLIVFPKYLWWPYIYIYIYIYILMRWGWVDDHVRAFISFEAPEEKR
jgi:hypothetical protein